MKVKQKKNLKIPKTQNNLSKALEKKIYKLFTNDPSLKITITAIHKKLGVSEHSKADVTEAVVNMWEKGKLNKERARYFLEVEKLPNKGKKLKAKQEKQQSGMIEGVVDMTNSGSAYIISEQTKKDVFIPPGRLNRAFDGDRVRVKVKGKRRGRVEGEIVEIIERCQEQFTGILKVSRRHAFLIPDKADLKVDIFVPYEKINGATDGDKVLVTIYEWPKDKKSPVARVDEVLGKPGDNNVEMQSILVESGFPLKFPEKVMQEANAIKDEIPAEEIESRRDMRGIPTYTIDPTDAKDFDDAISILKLDNGNWEVGIHIADVSHYVAPNTALDKEAYKRATSVYLVDRVLPMFPERLSNKICSLRPNEEKLCFSAIFEMDEEGDLYTEWFGRTVILSDKRFTYSDAQEVLDTGEGPMAEELKISDHLAKKLRAERFKEGSINFGSEEVRFILDENGKPVDVYVKKVMDTNLLIEDFMLLANRRVAHYVNKYGDGKANIPFVNRVHEAPDLEKLQSFSQFAATFGYKELQLDTPQQITDSLNSLLSQIKDKPEQNILQSLAIRSMAKAAYSTKNAGHYGLAFEDYAHFTSPIRRYPDVMVHRILANVFKGLDHVNFKVGELEKKCEHTSIMERKALTAERTSIKYKQVEYMEERVGEEFEGVISGVVKFGLFVEAKANKCEGLVHLDRMYDDSYLFDESRHQIVGKNYGKKYQLGDEVKIRVVGTDLAKRTIDFELI